MSDWMIKKDLYNTFWIYKNQLPFESIPQHHSLHDFFESWMRFLENNSENWEENNDN